MSCGGYCMWEWKTIKRILNFAVYCRFTSMCWDNIKLLYSPLTWRLEFKLSGTGNLWRQRDNWRRLFSKDSVVFIYSQTNESVNTCWLESRIMRKSFEIIKHFSQSVDFHSWIYFMFLSFTFAFIKHAVFLFHSPETGDELLWLSHLRTHRNLWRIAVLWKCSHYMLIVRAFCLLQVTGAI